MQGVKGAMEQNINLTIRISKELRDKATEISRAQGISLSKVIRDFLEQYAKENTKK